MDPQILVRATDKTSLSEADLLAGRRLIDALARRGIEIVAAMWLLLTEDKVWRLYLASAFVETEGPRMLYRIIESTMRDEEIPISMWDVAVTNTRHEMVHGWRRRSLDPVEGAVRINEGSILGKDFDDGYVYLLEETAAEPRANR